MVTLNARSERWAREALRRVARKVQKVMVPLTQATDEFGQRKVTPSYPYQSARFLGFRVFNVFGKAHTGFPISVDRLERENETSVLEYETERIRSVTFLPLENSSAQATIYHTGSVVMKGAESEREFYEAFEALFPVLARYERSVGL